MCGDRGAGRARRRGALLKAMTSRLVRATNGFDCIDPLTVPLHDPVKGHLSGHIMGHCFGRQQVGYIAVATNTGGRLRSAAMASSTCRCGFATFTESRRIISAILALDSCSTAACIQLCRSSAEALFHSRSNVSLRCVLCVVFFAVLSPRLPPPLDATRHPVFVLARVASTAVGEVQSLLVFPSLHRSPFATCRRDFQSGYEHRSMRFDLR